MTGSLSLLLLLFVMAILASRPLDVQSMCFIVSKNNKLEKLFLRHRSKWKRVQTMRQRLNMTIFHLKQNDYYQFET